MEKVRTKGAYARPRLKPRYDGETKEKCEWNRDFRRFRESRTYCPSRRDRSGICSPVGARRGRSGWGGQCGGGPTTSNFGLGSVAQGVNRSNARRIGAPMTDWVRVSKRRPCSICSKPDWCTVSADGSVECCMRVESAIPIRNGGWLHRLDGDDWRKSRARRAAVPSRPARDFRKLAERYELAEDTDAWTRFANELGVSSDSLRRLHVGWEGEA